jgi:hypothetical protein
VIIWLNGTFGCGKTTSTAAELHSLIPSGRVFDPETVGYMLQPNLADQRVSDFQHWPPWRALVVATAAELARFTGQHLIAPQTILVRAYLEQIFAGLRDAGLDVFHIVLDAGEEVLRQRIQGSAEAQAWRLDHLAEYRSSCMDDPDSRPLPSTPAAGPPLRSRTRSPALCANPLEPERHRLRDQRQMSAPGQGQIRTFLADAATRNHAAA